MTDKQLLINYCKEIKAQEESMCLFESTFGFAYYRLGYRLKELSVVVMIEINALNNRIKNLLKIIRN